MFCFVEPSLCSYDFELRKEFISRFASLRYAVQFGDGFLFTVRIVKGRVKFAKECVKVIRDREDFCRRISLAIQVVLREILISNG